MPERGFLDALPASVEPVTGEPDDTEGVYARDRRRELVTVAVLNPVKPPMATIAVLLNLQMDIAQDVSFRRRWHECKVVGSHH